MKAEEFKNNFEIDRAIPRGVRATVRTKAADIPPHLTADRKIYDPSKTYLFYDGHDRQIHESTGLRRMKDGYLGYLGIRVVAIGEIYEDRDDALTAGQTAIHDEIAILRKRIGDFELGKTATNRSLKSLLDSRNPETSEADFLG